MNKKIISVVMSAVMLFGAISFAGCQDNTAGLQAQIDELQAKLEEKAETIEELQEQVESQAGKIEQLENEKQELIDEMDALAPSEKFYSLGTAYDMGWITQEDLLSIAYYHGDRTVNYQLMGENYTPIPKTPETLDKETELAIQEKIAKGYRERPTNPIPEAKAEDVEVIYYGTYHGFVAVMTFALCNDDGYMNWETMVTIGGVVFGYSVEGISIRLWKL